MENSEQKKPVKNLDEKAKPVAKKTTPNPQASKPSTAKSEKTLTKKPDVKKAESSGPAKSSTPKPQPTLGAKPVVNNNLGLSKIPNSAPKTDKLNPGIKNPNIKPTAKPSVLPVAQKGVSKPVKEAGDRPNIKTVDAKNIEVKTDNTENKKKKRRLLLLLLLLLLIGIGVGTAIYFITKIPKTEIRFSVVVEQKFNNTKIDSAGEEVELPPYVPGDQMEFKELKFRIINDKGAITDSERVFLRFKIEILSNENYFGGLLDPDFENPDDWVYHEGDNYYYYKYFCYGNEALEPFKQMDFVADRNNNALNGQKGKIVITVEILEGNYSAISSEWNTAPDSKVWKAVKKQNNG